MKSSIEIIRECKSDADALIRKIEAFVKDASDLQRKLLSLPGVGGADTGQSKAIDDATEGLRVWRRTYLTKLAKAFGDINWID